MPKVIAVTLVRPANQRKTLHFLDTQGSETGQETSAGSSSQAFKQPSSFDRLMVEKGLAHRVCEMLAKRPQRAAACEAFHMGAPKRENEKMMMTFFSRGIRALSLAIGLVALLAAAMGAAMTGARANEQFTAQEVIDSGHKFFGATSGGLATVVEKVFASYGLPNGYVLGEEGSGAFIGGLTYGEGTLFTKNAGDHKVFWQGPSLGWDFGGQGSRTMILVYNLDTIDALYARFGGVAGSAYVVAGLGFNVMKNGNVLLVPVRTGVGARLGVNVGYLKMTPNPTWNPF